MTSSNINILFVFNKYDLDEERRLTNFEINEYVDENKDKFEKFEISLKTKLNVDKLFQRIQECLNNKENSSKKPLLINKDIVENFLEVEGTINLILIGDSGVGKSQFFLRFFTNEYKDEFSSTIGMDRRNFSVKYNNLYYRVILNDTAGQERFRSLPMKYYQNADGALLLYDLENKTSFYNIKNWVEGMRNASNTNKVIYLVGNKIDLVRKTSYQEGKELATSFGLKYFEISCKININIEEIVYRLITDCLGSFKRNNTISIKKGKINKKKCC